MKYSVVIPVFNSERIVGETVDRVAAFFQRAALDFEIVLVNDGSRDRSWEILQQKARQFPQVIAVNLLRNYGQHVAILCGFHQASGDYVITMDDDLQNPPEEIAKLIDGAAGGRDLVVGQFKAKKHSWIRRLGTRVLGLLHRRIFNSPRGWVSTNFRLIRRDVIERVCEHRGSYPYMPGLLLLYSINRVNVLVEHRERRVGKSNYNAWRISRLLLELLFNYSSFPLRFVSGCGLLVALLSLGLGVFYLTKALWLGTSVPGWATLVVLLSFFNGTTLLILGMLGEYLVRLINQTSQGQVYHVKEIVHE